LDIPFIIVSGAIGEETAVKCLKAGALDFIAKDNLGRLVPAIERELKDHQVRIERRRTEQALRESEELFRAIANTANDAIIMTDSKGIVTLWNPGAEKVFGFSQAEAIGNKLHELIILPEHREEYRHKLSVLLAIIRSEGERRSSGRTEERITVNKNGDKFPIEYSSSAVMVNGKCHTVEIIRDISSRRRLEMQLRQSQKLEAIGTLAAGIAHEINTPTQFIGDNLRFLAEAFTDIDRLNNSFQKSLELLKKESQCVDIVRDLEVAIDKADIDYLREEIPSAVSQSLDGIERVTSIVRAMRDFAHPGPEGKTPMNLNSMIESTVTVARNEWKYVADVETEFDDTLPLVPCIPGEINQIILNLIVNAAHAIADVVGKDSAEKGNIRIATGIEGDMAIVRVSDTGTGIPVEIRDRIFDPFFTTKDVGKGTGQGLAIARSVIVEKHGGKIDFESAEGEGTTFTIQLPLEDPNMADSAE